MGDKNLDYFLALFFDSIPYLSIFIFIFVSRYIKRKHLNSKLASVLIRFEKYFGILLVILFIFSLVFGIKYMHDYLG